MAYLENYIERGKEITGTKSASVMAIIGAVVAGMVAFFFYYLVHQPSVQSLIEDIPTIEIGQEQVRHPLNTVWERKISDTDITIKLDTNQDVVLPDAASGLFLGRRFLIVALRGQAMRYALPVENISITPTLIKQILKQIAVQIGLMVGILVFLFLFIGYWGTVGLSLLIFRILKKNNRQVRRGAWIGWWSVVGLDIIFLLCRTPFSLVGSLFLATIITIFCLLQLEDSHG